jgi:hypothetical protein
MSSHVSSVWEAMGSPRFFKTYGKLPTPPGWDVVGSGDPQHRVERFRGVRVLQRLAQNDGEFRLKVDLAMAQYEKMGGIYGDSMISMGMCFCWIPGAKIYDVDWCG